MAVRGVLGTASRIGGCPRSLQVVGSSATLILLLLSQGFDRQPFVDLALIAAVMSFIGSVVLAGFIEQRVR